MIMLEVGQEVRVLAPFDESFPEVYAVREVLTQEDGNVVYFIGDIEGAFDIVFLEAV
jgi:hypothetical protein